jgi:hypothetical protein
MYRTLLIILMYPTNRITPVDLTTPQKISLRATMDMAMATMMAPAVAEIALMIPTPVMDLRTNDLFQRQNVLLF